MTQTGRTSIRGRSNASKPERIVKERLTVHVPVDLIDEVKDAVVALSGPPLRLTLAAFAEEAFRRHLDHLRETERKGKPFPKRQSELRGGRPLK